MLRVHSARHLILLNVLLILHFEVVVGDLNGLTQFDLVNQTIFDRPFFGNHVLAFAFLVRVLDFSVAWSDFGFQVLGLD